MYKKYNKHNEMINRNAAIKEKHNRDILIEHGDCDGKHSHYKHHELHQHDKDKLHLNAYRAEKCRGRETMRENSRSPAHYIRNRVPEKCLKSKERSPIPHKSHSSKRHHSARSRESVYKSPLKKHEPLQKANTFNADTKHPNKITEIVDKDKYLKHRSRSEKKSVDDKKVSEIWYCQVETNSPFKPYKKDLLGKTLSEQKKKCKSLKERSTSTHTRHSPEKHLLHVLTPDVYTSRIHHFKDPKFSTVIKTKTEKKGTSLERKNNFDAKTNKKSEKSNKEANTQKAKANKEIQHKAESQEIPVEVDKKIEDGMKMYFTKLQNLIDKKLDSLLHVKEDKSENKEIKKQSHKSNKNHDKPEARDSRVSESVQRKKEANDRRRKASKDRNRKTSKDRTDRNIKHRSIEDRHYEKHKAKLDQHLKTSPRTSKSRHKHRKHRSYPTPSPCRERNNSLVSVDLEYKPKNRQTESTKKFPQCHVETQAAFEVYKATCSKKISTDRNWDGSQNKDMTYSQKEDKDVTTEVKRSVAAGPSISNKCVKSSDAKDNSFSFLFNKKSSKYYSIHNQDSSPIENYRSKNESNYWVEGVEPAKKDTLLKTNRKKMTPKLECKTVSIVGIPPQIKTSYNSYSEAITVPIDEILEKKNRLKRFHLYYQYSQDNTQSIFSENDSGQNRVPSESLRILSDNSEQDDDYYFASHEKVKSINVLKAPSKNYVQLEDRNIWRNSRYIKSPESTLINIRLDDHHNFYLKQNNKNNEFIRLIQEKPLLLTNDRNRSQDIHKPNKDFNRNQQPPVSRKIKKPLISEVFLTSKSDVDVSYSSLIIGNKNIQSRKEIFRQNNTKRHNDIVFKQSRNSISKEDLSINEFFNNIDFFKKSFEKQTPEKDTTSLQVLQFLENMHQLYLERQQTFSQNKTSKEKSLTKEEHCPTLKTQVDKVPLNQEKRDTSLQELKISKIESAHKPSRRDFHVNMCTDVCDKQQELQIKPTNDKIDKVTSYHDFPIFSNKCEEVQADHTPEFSNIEDKMKSRSMTVEKAISTKNVAIANINTEETINQLPTNNNRLLTNEDKIKATSTCMSVDQSILTENMAIDNVKTEETIFQTPAVTNRHLTNNNNEEKNKSISTNMTVDESISTKSLAVDNNITEIPIISNIHLTDNGSENKSKPESAHVDESISTKSVAIDGQIEETFFQIPTIRNRHLKNLSDVDSTSKLTQSKNCLVKFSNSSAAGGATGDTNNKSATTNTKLLDTSQTGLETKHKSTDRVHKRKLKDNSNSLKLSSLKSVTTPLTKDVDKNRQISETLKISTSSSIKTKPKKNAPRLTVTTASGTTQLSTLPTILEKDKPKQTKHFKYSTNDPRIVKMKKRPHSASSVCSTTGKVGMDSRDYNIFKLKKSRSEINVDQIDLEREESQITSLVCLQGYQNETQLTDSSQANVQSLDRYLLSNKSLLIEHPYNSRLMVTKSYRTADVSAYQKRKKYDELIRRKMKKRMSLQEKQLGHIFEIRYLTLNGNTKNTLSTQQEKVEIPQSEELTKQRLLKHNAEEKIKKLTNKKYKKFLDFIKQDVNMPYSNLFEFLSQLPDAALEQDSHRHSFNSNKCKQCDGGKNFMQFVNYLCNSLKSKCSSGKSTEEESIQSGASSKPYKKRSENKKSISRKNKLSNMRAKVGEPASSCDEENQEKVQFSLSNRTERPAYLSCPLLKVRDSSFDFLYQEDTSTNDEDKLMMNSKRPLNPILGFSLNSESVLTDNTKYRPVSTDSPCSETSGYASSRSKHSFSFTNFFKRPKVAALLKPQIEEGIFGKEISYNKMVQEYNDNAQRADEESEANLEINDEFYKEIPLDILLKNSNSSNLGNSISNIHLRYSESEPYTIQQEVLVLKKFASDTNLLSNATHLKSADFIIEPFQKTGTLTVSEVHADVLPQNQPLHDSVQLLQKNSNQSISMLEKMLDSEYYLPNLSSCSITLVESSSNNEFDETVRSNPNNTSIDDMDNSSDIKRLVMKKFFENILEMYESETVLSSALCADVEFMENELMSFVKANKKPLRSRIKKFLKKIFHRKQKLCLYNIESENVEKPEPIDNEYQKTLQSLARSAHKYFSMLVQAVAVNNKMDDEMKMYGILRLLEAIEKGHFTFLKKFVSNQENVNLEEEIRDQVKQTFISVYSSAKNEAVKYRRKLSSNDMKLMGAFVCKYRIGLLSKTDIIASYIGKGFFENENQLKAAVIYLLKNTNEVVNFQDFEDFCRNHLLN